MPRHTQTHTHTLLHKIPACSGTSWEEIVLCSSTLPVPLSGDAGELHFCDLEVSVFDQWNESGRCVEALWAYTQCAMLSLLTLPL